MATYTAYTTYDTSVVANYVANGQMWGNALSSFGWTKVSDSAQVNWATVTSTGTSAVPTYRPGFLTGITGGSVTAWSAGSLYTGVAGNSTGSFSIVTNGGLTFGCIAQTYGNNFTTVVQNTAQSFSLTSVNGSTQPTYNGTITGGASNAFRGYIFTITGFVNSNNNITAICLESTATTLVFAIAVSTTSETHAGTATSSASNAAFSGTVGFFAGNNYQNLVGHTVVSTGFGFAGNNTTFTVLANGYDPFFGNFWIGGAVSGSSASAQTGTIAETTAPLSDTVHWTPYNYEIWQSTGSASSIYPIYVKIIYTAISNNPSFMVNVGSSYSSAIVFGNNTGEVLLGYQNSAGNGTQCTSYFSGTSDSFSTINYFGLGSETNIMILDRSRDNTGNALTNYVQVGHANANSTIWDTIFRPGVGGVFTTTTGYWASIGYNQNTMNYNGSVAVQPLFATPGYISNPVLGGIAMCTNDFSAGQLVNAVVLGTSHTYLMSRDRTPCGGTLQFVGIRWE